jgi:hypothetical protein
MVCDGRDGTDPFRRKSFLDSRLRPVAGIGRVRRAATGAATHAARLGWALTRHAVRDCATSAYRHRHPQDALTHRRRSQWSLMVAYGPVDAVGTDTGVLRVLGGASERRPSDEAWRALAGLVSGGPSYRVVASGSPGEARA